MNNIITTNEQNWKIFEFVIFKQKLIMIKVKDQITNKFECLKCLTCLNVWNVLHVFKLKSWNVKKKNMQTWDLANCATLHSIQLHIEINLILNFFDSFFFFNFNSNIILLASDLQVQIFIYGITFEENIF